ncbi:MAG: ECF transporter S component [Clostridia bacterium]|nr:ECF transporter S component [Clostridia bacterium]
MVKDTKARTRKLVGIGLFSAIVVVLQILGAFIRLGPFSVSLVLIPIVVGSSVYGKGAGAWLGFLFGIAVLISGDASTFLAINAPGTFITVLLKGTLAGLCIDLVSPLLMKVNKYLGVFASAVLCPVVNTGIFLLGCRLFFFDTIAQWSAGTEYGSDVAAYMIFVLVGGNFLFELLFNIVLSPFIVRIVDIGKKNDSK